MKFMKAEGDRSGVDTPSREAKACFLIGAAATLLLDRNWNAMTADQILAVVVEAKDRLERARMQLEGGP